MECAICHVCSVQLGRIVHCKETSLIHSLDKALKWLHYRWRTNCSNYHAGISNRLPPAYQTPQAKLHVVPEPVPQNSFCTAPLHTHWHCPKAPQAREGLPEGWSEVWGVPQPQQWVKVPGVKGVNRIIFKPWGAYTIRHKLIRLHTLKSLTCRLHYEWSSAKCSAESEPHLKYLPAPWHLHLIELNGPCSNRKTRASVPLPSLTIPDSLRMSSNTSRVRGLLLFLSWASITYKQAF